MPFYAACLAKLPSMAYNAFHKRVFFKILKRRFAYQAFFLHKTSQRGIYRLFRTAVFHRLRQIDDYVKRARLQRNHREYATPQGCFADEAVDDEYDKAFPRKEKLGDCLKSGV